MILVGQYDSPFVRRVAVSLRVLGLAYEHDTRSVFADFDAMRQVNPLGRIPSLVLDDGETLINSTAILDWLDQSVGPGRSLVPPNSARAPSGPASHSTGNRSDRQSRSGHVRTPHPPVSQPLARVDRTLPHPGDGRDRSPGRRALADVRPDRPGANHRCLHDPLRANIRPRSASA